MPHTLACTQTHTSKPSRPNGLASAHNLWLFTVDSYWQPRLTNAVQLHSIVQMAARLDILPTSCCCFCCCFSRGSFDACCKISPLYAWHFVPARLTFASAHLPIRSECDHLICFFFTSSGFGLVLFLHALAFSADMYAGASI